MNQLKWWQKTLVYQVYPKSFQDTTGTGTGDLPGVTRRLDYLKSLGVGAIWLTPCYPSPMVDNGYDIADYCAIDPAYGTMEDMETLIAEAKKRGIRIVMDLVYNHSSDQHPWFLESKRDRTNDKADWYIWRDPKEDGSAPTNWRGIFGGSAWTYVEERGQYYLHTFAEAQPDLNWENPAVRHALYDAANFWLRKGVGGFRIDAIVYIKKPSVLADGKPDAGDGMVSIHEMIANTPGILDFLYEFRREVFDGHDIFTVAEANSVPPEDLCKWVGEKGAFSMLFEFTHMNLEFEGGEIWCHAKKWPLTKLKGALTASQKGTAASGWYPIFFENHDQIRSVSRYFSADADPILAAKAMATVLLTLRGTPFVFEGQELGMRNMKLPRIEDYDDISSHGQYQLALDEGFSPKEALAFVQAHSRDNARTPMQWSKEKNAGFTAGTPWLPVHPDFVDVNVEAEDRDAGSVLNYYRALAHERLAGKASHVLLAGDYRELMEEDERIYAFSRSFGDHTAYVLVNFTAKDAPYDEGVHAGAKRLFGNYADTVRGTLRPCEARVYIK